MKLNWNFLGGGGVQNKKPSKGGVWIFSGSAQFKYNYTNSNKFNCNLLNIIFLGYMLLKIYCTCSQHAPFSFFLFLCFYAAKS